MTVIDFPLRNQRADHSPEYLAKALRWIADQVESCVVVPGLPIHSALVILRHEHDPIGNDYGRVSVPYFTINLSIDEALAAMARTQRSMLTKSEEG